MGQYFTDALPGVRVQPRLRELGYSGRVRLTGGPLAERFDEAAATLMALSPDDILHGFREAAGMPSSGQHLSGWAAPFSHDTLGQWASALARLTAITGEPSYAERGIELVEGWAATTTGLADRLPDNITTYRWEKMLCGAVDLAVLCGWERGLSLATDLTRGALRTWDLRRTRPVPTDFAGNTPDGTLEWYTLSENLYRAALAGGDAELLDAAAMFHYDDFWDRFREAPPTGARWDVPVWLHAYSHVNSFASAAARYAATGEPHLLDVLRNGHDWVTGTQCYATGGYGPGEWTVPHDGTLGRALEWRTDTAEVVCGSWAAFKLSTALACATGEARYLDWAERLVHSGIGAVPAVALDGTSPYYHDYRLGIATMLPFWDAFPCCSGTYFQAVAHLADLVFFESDGGVAVGLYTPARLETTIDGVAVTFDLDADVPSRSTAVLTITAGRPVSHEVRLRVPDWVEIPAVRVDGRSVAASSHDGWLSITRTWGPRSVIEIDLPARLQALPVDEWHPERVALAYGPTVLAQEAQFTRPLQLPEPVEILDVDAVLERVGPMRWTPTSASATAHLRRGGLRPLSTFGYREPYRVYHDGGRSRVI